MQAPTPDWAVIYRDGCQRITANLYSLYLFLSISSRYSILGSWGGGWGKVHQKWGDIRRVIVKQVWNPSLVTESLTKKLLVCIATLSIAQIQHPPSFTIFVTRKNSHRDVYAIISRSYVRIKRFNVTLNPNIEWRWDERFQGHKRTVMTLLL